MGRSSLLCATLSFATLASSTGAFRKTGLAGGYPRGVQRSDDWLNQAKRDLEHARNDVQHEFFEWAGFSAQQAAEKAVKAVFQAMSAEARGHAVTELLTALGASHSVSADLVDGARELDLAYIPTRYPDAFPSGAPTDFYTHAQAQRLIEHADRIVRFCQDLLARP